MKRKYKVLIAILAVAAVGFIPSYFLLIRDNGADPEAGPGETYDVEAIQAIQLEPGDDYIEVLEGIVNRSEDPMVRETALMALTDIAIRKYETEKVVDFLKDVATNTEEDENVMSAAYACVDLIREIYPLEEKGTLDVDLTGDIRKDGIVTVLATVSATVDIEALVGISSLHLDIEPLAQVFYKIRLEADSPQQVEFELHLKEVGQYSIPVTLMLSFDKVDEETITKSIFVDVQQDSGESYVYEEWW